jgi:hypothetical protein
MRVSLFILVTECPGSDDDWYLSLFVLQKQLKIIFNIVSIL